MINLDKLKQPFDMESLKNLNLADLTRIATEHRDSLIKLGLIAGSLLAAGLMFNDTRVKDQDLQARISQARQKLEVLNGRDAAVRELNGFKSSLPKKLNEFELIALISNYAKLRHVAITSLSPAQSEDMGLYDLINVSFDAVSDNFKEMMLFLRNIEKSDYPLRIDSWSGHEAEDGKIIFSMQLSAVLIHT